MGFSEILIGFPVSKELPGRLGPLPRFSGNMKHVKKVLLSDALSQVEPITQSSSGWYCHFLKQSQDHCVRVLAHPGLKSWWLSSRLAGSSYTAQLIFNSTPSLSFASSTELLCNVNYRTLHPPPTVTDVFGAE